jgi:hypothetical protein
MKSKKKEFKIDAFTSQIYYDPLVDRHLEYFFSSKNNRQNLIKTKILNKKN